MHFFNLTLPARLALAVLSGALTFPAIQLDTALGPESYPPLFSWWLVLHGIIFGLLVMAPFVARKEHRALRVIAMMLASVFIYDAALKIPDLIEIQFIGETGDFILAGISGALLVAAAVRFIAWYQGTLAYWGLCFLAGLIGGYVFSVAFEFCSWDKCDTTWMVLPYVSGWITWQALVCAAMYIGLNQNETVQRSYGLSTR